MVEFNLKNADLQDVGWINERLQVISEREKLQRKFDEFDKAVYAV